MLSLAIHNFRFLLKTIALAVCITLCIRSIQPTLRTASSVELRERRKISGIVKKRVFRVP